MKKITLLLITAFFLAVTGFTQEGGSPAKPELNGWKQKDRADFISECVKAASAGMSLDSAKSYCHCMQDIMEEKYPDVNEAGAITAEEMQSEGWKKLITDCLRTYWTTQERADFLSECVAAATPNVGAARAASYCDCMLYKVQKFYPVFQNTTELTDEKLQSPQWKKIISTCLEF